MFGKCLHRQEYKVLRKGLDAGLSKQQISNLFSSQGALCAANLSALTAIERFSGVRNGNIRTDFYDDCQDIPCIIDAKLVFQIHQHWTPHKRICCCWTIASSASRIKPKHTTLEVDTTTAIRYTLLKTISGYHDIQFEKIQTLFSCSHKT